MVWGDDGGAPWMTERAQTACCHASEVVLKSEAPEQSEDRGVVRGDDERGVWFPHALI